MNAEACPHGVVCRCIWNPAQKRMLQRRVLATAIHIALERLVPVLWLAVLKKPQSAYVPCPNVSPAPVSLWRHCGRSNNLA